MSEERTDLYAVLGLDEGASQAQIRRAFRVLLRRHHPDTRPPQDPARSTLSDAAVQQVIAAYAVLGDPVRRAHYDRRARPRKLESARGRPSHAPASQESWSGRPPIQAGPVHWHRA